MLQTEFRYLVMERMAAPLSEIVPILLSNSSSSSKAASTKIPLGDVATSLFNCIHAMHTQNYLFQDVKPDNFMLAKPSNNNNNSRGKKTSNNVASRIRLIDFGLVERYSDMSSTSHREDAFPGAPLVGTPTYASLNVMGGHTPSRRDDLEALGYVICEVILLLIQSSGGSKRRGKGGDEDVLPWSQAKSDDELYQIKQQEMDKSKRSKSTLFNELKVAGVDVQMGKYFNEVMSLEYAEKPDYDSLRGHLNKITVTATLSSGGGKVAATTKRNAKTADAAAASPKKPAAAAATAGKSPRRYPSRRTKEKEQTSQSSESSDENVENCKKQKVSSRTIATQTDSDMICLLDDSSEEEGNEVEDMDWELLDSNDNDGNVAATAAAASRSKSAFLKLEVISGAQKGQEVSFGGDYPDTVVVGREPGSSTAKALRDSAKLALTQDDRISSVHAKFVIASKKNLHSVRITDMSSSSSDEMTLINGTRLASGKSRQAFVGDKITMGGAILQVKRA